MSLYINTATGEYPRHPGDVELDPTAPWAEVTETTPDGDPADGMMWVEDTPVETETGWVQTWKQAQRPVRTKEQVLARLGLTPADLALLMS